jgi:type I restriction enzyme S subunit
MFLGKFLRMKLRKVEKPNESYLRLGVRSHGKGIFTTTVIDPDTVAMSHLFKVHTGDLIVSITFAWEGAIAMVTAEGDGALVSHRFPTYIFDKSKVLPEYFQYLMLSRRFFYDLGLISPGGAGRNRVMSKQDFLKLKVQIPPIPEERKIADILFTWDEAIARTERLIAVLKARKKGFLQRLLTGQVRFPGFSQSDATQEIKYGAIPAD